MLKQKRIVKDSPKTGSVSRGVIGKAIKEVKANKTKRCKFCKEPCLVDGGIQTMRGFFCDYDNCMKGELAKINERKKKKASVEFNRETKRMKAKIDVSDVRYQHALTQKVFNRLRVLQELKWFSDRELAPVCICCQNPLGNDQWCHGHFKSVGSNSALRYDFKNGYLTHNRNCNMAKSGDIQGLKNGLLMRFGEKEGLAIIEYCETHERSRKYTGEELIGMRKDFSRQIREIENSTL